MKIAKFLNRHRKAKKKLAGCTLETINTFFWKSPIERPFFTIWHYISWSSVLQKQYRPLKQRGFPTFQLQAAFSYKTFCELNKIVNFKIQLSYWKTKGLACNPLALWGSFSRTGFFCPIRTYLLPDGCVSVQLFFHVIVQLLLPMCKSGIEFASFQIALIDQLPWTVISWKTPNSWKCR